MNLEPCLSYAGLYESGHFESFADRLLSPSELINMVTIERPGGDVSRPAVSDIVLYQELHGGARLNADFGAGRIAATAQKGSLFLAAPNFSVSTVVDGWHRVRSIAFPLQQWRVMLDEASDGRSSFDNAFIYGQNPDSPVIRAALQNLWSLAEDEGAPSRLLARAAGCEILAELCRLRGESFKAAKGGLASWAVRRCKEILHARFDEDICLDELAAEVHLSPFHFARMFKNSFGMPPRVYLTKVRIEKACDLLEKTDLSIMEVALEVGYSSSQVLARVFVKHRHMCPTDYRRLTHGR
ncbi:AraC family transcriptional regulator [Halodurantibacterium flavum]|uniref:Helix-turn-helix domain-containing protein n=1 Tax=Halodurantibacterium flavum TaxID=1382802 RepID=A0ABW4S161_9RHOB